MKYATFCYDTVEVENGLKSGSFRQNWLILTGSCEFFEERPKNIVEVLEQVTFLTTWMLT